MALDFLADDEAAFFATQTTRCAGCGHLNILHNTHCCEYCQLPGCRCQWGSLPEDDDEE